MVGLTSKPVCYVFCAFYLSTNDIGLSYLWSLFPIWWFLHAKPVCYAFCAFYLSTNDMGLSSRIDPRSLFPMWWFLHAKPVCYALAVYFLPICLSKLRRINLPSLSLQSVFPIWWLLQAKPSTTCYCLFYTQCLKASFTHWV